MITDSIETLMDLMNTVETEYFDMKRDIDELKANCAVEGAKKAAGDEQAQQLRSEIDRLQEKQAELVDIVGKQYDFRKKYETTCQLKEAAEKAFESKAEEYAKALELLSKEKDMKYLQYQQETRQLQNELSAKSHVVEDLEGQLAQIKQELCDMKKNEEEARRQDKSLYGRELEDVRKALEAEQQKNRNLMSDLQKAERLATASRMKLEEQMRDGSSSRQSDAFKQKIMKLRKENDELKRQLQQLQR